jgi:hypothetical protein
MRLQFQIQCLITAMCNGSDLPVTAVTHATKACSPATVAGFPVMVLSSAERRARRSRRVWASRVSVMRLWLMSSSWWRYSNAKSLASAVLQV